MRKLNQREIELLNKLYEDCDLIARGNIRKFLLANTYVPKYSVGDFVLATEYGSYIYGNPIKNVKCVITEIHYCLIDKGDEHVTYECIALDDEGNEYFICVEEYLSGKIGDRFISGICDNNINHFESKSKYSQSMSI